MGAIDRRILRALHGQARLTNAELSEQWSAPLRVDRTGDLN